MRQQGASIEKTFVKGRLSEFTGLNFPEDACTDELNCIFERTGLVTRRLGVDFEASATSISLSADDSAISKFYWKNVAGDGTLNILVTQVGDTLHFWDVSTPAKAANVSSNKFAGTVDLNTFSPSGGTDPTETECQYAFGFGYLLVFHPYLEPFYVSYSAGAFTAVAISVSIRDTTGVDEAGVPDNLRPAALTADHEYNLYNQGWTNAAAWSATSSGALYQTGSHTYGVASGLSISVSDPVSIGALVNFGGTVYFFTAIGIVTAYSGTSLTINITSLQVPVASGSPVILWQFSKVNAGLLTTWNGAIGGYPSNADVWWNFKNASGVFAPVTTAANVTLNNAPAPKGYFIFPAFNQNRSTISGVASVTAGSITSKRPSTGSWFQGRVWYSGVHDTGLNNKIYFSQIVEKAVQLGKCYQQNDPTSENLFDLLPGDGGVIAIKEAETIRKLYPWRNMLIVEASNGIWAISGSVGIGFTATDYTVQKLDAIPVLSHCSFVDVRGVPMWWNTEGIYTLVTKDSDIQVQSLTTGTIASYFASIPALSKKFARGYYNRDSFIVQWLFRSTEASTLTETYEFDSVLNLNTITGAFYTYRIMGTPKILDVVVLDSDGDLSTDGTVIEPTFKYLTKSGTTVTFSEERDETYLDFVSYDDEGVDYSSYAVSGYRVHGDAQRKTGLTYLLIYSDGTVGTQYRVQGLWDYATSGNTGRWGVAQIGIHLADDYQYNHRRFKIRGNGLAYQIKISSITGQPFQIIGWSAHETGASRA